MKIPKILHFTWLSPNPLPTKYQKNIDTWRKFHPDWKINIWEFKNLPRMQCQHEFNNATKLVRKSDILRLDVLKSQGGVYSDCDIYALRNIEPAIDNISAFAVREDNIHVCNALMGCTPGHPWMCKAIDLLPEHCKISMRCATGRFMLTKFTKDYQDVKVFDPDVFFPRKAATYPDTSYTVHEWDGARV